MIDAVRITPAYAGRRYNRWIGSWGIRDHPRVRGEKTRSSIAEYASGGSPPRTRGEEGEPEHKAEDDRITPAYAGRRGRLRLANSSAGDHPRVRGEKQRTSISYMSRHGSPPRTRGEVGTRCPSSYRLRITPAYAGRSHRGRQGGSQSRDHPRVRGEKGSADHFGETIRGSPPRTRGEVTGSDLNERRAGITPAYAGRRAPNDRSHTRQWDHPRVRGEKDTEEARSETVKGSPPRTRGEAKILAGQRSRFGITPAYAGRSLPASAPPSTSGDHPRVRGEKASAESSVSSLRGSPPRTRGEAWEEDMGLATIGITPAYAGRSDRTG